jgi:hypothetical protein
MVKTANGNRHWRAYSVGLVAIMAFPVALAAQSLPRVRFVAGPALAKEPLKFTVTGSGLDTQSTQVTFTGGGCKPCAAEPGAPVKASRGTEAALTGQMTLNAGRYAFQGHAWIGCGRTRQCQDSRCRGGPCRGADQRLRRRVAHGCDGG